MKIVHTHFNRKQTWLLIGGIVIVLVITTYVLLKFLPTKNTIQSAAPTFSALSPNGKTPDWKQSKPQGGSNESAVYIYPDTISNVPIKVSEQPLPPSFHDDPSGKVAEVAEGFNATNTMQVNGVTVYIGTSTKGPQSVIFSDGKLLVLIKSDAVITNGAWADYIKALK